MKRSSTSKYAALRDIQNSGLPRNVLRQLVERLELGIGGRALVAGGQSGSILRFLNGLGIDGAGLLDCTTGTSPLPADSGFHSDFEIVRCDPRASVPFAGGSFDAVVVYAMAGHECSLFSADALQVTANLLATLRAGGRLAVVVESQPEDGHSQRCFERHLQVFGDVRETQPATRRFPFGTPRQAHSLQILQTPAQPVSRQEWLKRASETTWHPAATCCSAYSASSAVGLSEAA